MIMSIVGIKDVSFEAVVKENHVQNNDKQLEGLHIYTFERCFLTSIRGQCR